MAVELQLGLALPTGLTPPPISIVGSLIDLNTSDSYSDESESYATNKFHRSSMSGGKSFDRNPSCCAIMKKNSKRSFDEASEADSTSTDSPLRTLPLFLWNKQPKDDDDLPNDRKTCNLALINRNGEETEGIVGWPPIKTYRKKQRGQDPSAVWNGRRRGGVGSNCLFVKAQIQGVLITRKIDLSLHRCYETLTSALIFMFGRGHESVEEYTLTYQNNQGDWLVVADVPWRTFLESVQRLKLTRKEDW